MQIISSFRTRNLQDRSSPHCGKLVSRTPPRGVLTKEQVVALERAKQEKRPTARLRPSILVTWVRRTPFMFARSKGWDASTSRRSSTLTVAWPSPSSTIARMRPSLGDAFFEKYFRCNVYCIIAWHLVRLFLWFLVTQAYKTLYLGTDKGIVDAPHPTQVFNSDATLAKSPVSHT